MTEDEAKTYPTVRAYDIGYRNGECAREVGSGRFFNIAAIEDILREGRDQTDRDNILHAAQDGYNAGLYNEDPLTAVQVAIHYD